MLLFQEILIVIYLGLIFIIENTFVYNFLMIVAIALATGVYILGDLRNSRSVLRTYKLDLLLLFMGVNILSMIVNLRYGISDNLFFLFTLILDYFILYSIGANKSEINLKKIFNTVSHTFIILYTLWALLSFFTFCIGYKLSYINEENLIRRGFVDNRLFGFFGDPNYAATNCFAICCLCVYFAFKAKSKLTRGLYIASSCMLIFYLVLSGSRTALLSGYVAIIFGSFFFAYKIFQNKYSFFKRNLLCVMVSVILTFSAIGTVDVLRFALPYIPSGISYFLNHERVEVKTLAREDVEEGEDYSNNRLKIWSAAFDIYKSKPIIGTSPRNLVAYAQKTYPENYIAQSKYMVHNGLFEILVFNGILGFSILCMFIGCCAFRSFQHILTKTNDHFAEVLLGIMVIITLMTSTMTLSGLFYNRGIYNSLFWATLGMLTYYTCPKPKNRTLKLFYKIFKRKNIKL